MPVEITTNVVVKTPDGEVVGKYLSQFSHAKVTCKQCSKVIEWDENTAQEHLPDDFFSIVGFQDSLQNKDAFCTKECLIQYLDGFEPPVPPRKASKQMTIEEKYGTIEV